MSSAEYLINYGHEGFFGRFSTEGVRRFCRGDAVVVHSHRGVELGTVVGSATAGHSRFLPNRLLGELIRPAEDEDLRLAAEDSDYRTVLIEQARHLARSLSLPVEIVDIEVILEPRTLIVHYFRLGSGAVRPLVAALSTAVGAAVEMQDLALGIATEFGDHADPRKCVGGCGSGGGGCSSGGGCSGGSCGSGDCGSGGCGTKSTPVVEHVSHHSVDDERQFFVELLPTIRTRPI